MRPFVWNAQAEPFEHRFSVLAPRDRHGRRADRVLEHQVPADDPRDELAHRRVGVGVGAAGDGNHRRELGVAEAGERAADAGDDEREDDRRAGAIGDSRGRADEQAGADDRADAERDERYRAQGALERALPGGRASASSVSMDLVLNNEPATLYPRVRSAVSPAPACRHRTGKRRPVRDGTMEHALP